MRKENIQISSLFFVVFSLSAFALVSFLYLFLSAKIHYSHPQKTAWGIEQVYTSEDFNSSDPLMTKAGGVKKIITGPIISNFDPYLGEFDAPIRIIVYSDFACKYCQEQEKIIKNILKKYEGNVRFIWKDYPDINANSISFKSSLAARCAQDQGKFWEYHDQLFQNISLVDYGYLSEIAKNIGLDTKRFDTCLSERDSQALIVSNIEEANAIGIIGVPSVYINDKEFIGKVSEEDFSLIIDSELQNE